MALNPIGFTEKVAGNFLRYQLTTYPFADEDLSSQLRSLLSLSETRRTPLFRGPFISLSRAFRQGATVAQLVAEGVLHPHLKQIHEPPTVYGHQERAIRSIVSGKTTLVSTGTGSGKTETFLFPIISHCLRLRDAGAAPGIVAVVIYPMNALAEDQLGRLREYLCGTSVSFGMYVGKTPEKAQDVHGEHLRPGASRADYRAAAKDGRSRGITVHPPEERCSREDLRSVPPRILLTNVKQLELLLTRQRDVELFAGSDLKFLVVDEAHTFGGAGGAETACLLRRLRVFCGKQPAETACIATSATLADPQQGNDAPRSFASRFFGVEAAAVEVIREEYENDDWAAVRSDPPTPQGELSRHLETLLRALDTDDGSAVSGAYAAFSGHLLGASPDWRETLGAELAGNELVFKLAERLAKPKLLSRLVEETKDDVGRRIDDEEILAWLALGAAALRGGRPVLRPIVHGFIRGIGGAVVAFPPDRQGPELRLGASEAWGPPQPSEPPQCQLPVLTCSTCGQHYFVQHAKDFRWGDSGAEGGDAVDGGSVWPPLDPELDGRRVVLLDRLVDLEPDDADHAAAASSTTAGPPLPTGAAIVHLCRHCGALHPAMSAVCFACGRSAPLVRMIAPRTEIPGGPQASPRVQPVLTRCVSCGAHGQPRGSRYREPIRQVRATTVSDIHVLAQEMVRHSDRRRLLVFADNRQDAAFQAGWMRDHARRFRLRALVDQELSAQPIAVGDLIARLDRRLADDPDLSQALLPEVWSEFGADDAPVEHEKHRRLYLRFFLVRELATGPRQRLGLEPWGRVRVTYVGLDSHTDFVREKAADFGLDAAELAEGIGALLDHQRRSMLLFDPETRAYTRIFDLDDRAIQRGYFVHLKAGPKGMRLERDPLDQSQRASGWLGRRPTFCSKTLTKWGIPSHDVPEFTRDLWAFLCNKSRILKAVDLVAGENKVLRGGKGVCQIDIERLRLVRHEGIWRCKRCRRNYARPLPAAKCIGFHCAGIVGFERPDPDDYDLLLLSEGGAMIKPREHSAQVPEAEQERLENAFKGDGDAVNTLVCTPTLELGVDIGHLDTVLMRNVPPRPANYWQRAGRAGRRRRMAVSLTYARPISHDQAYFADPVKMLAGAVEPPRFNLLNDELVRKHAHSSFVTFLRRSAARLGDTPNGDRLRKALAVALPPRVTTFLFDEQERVRTGGYDMAPFKALLEDFRVELVDYVRNVYAQHWPPDSLPVVSDESLNRYLAEMPERLERIIKLLERRLRWAQEQQRRLDVVRSEKGTLEPDEDALYRRCDRIIKRLKGRARDSARRSARRCSVTSSRSSIARPPTRTKRSPLTPTPRTRENRWSRTST